MESKEYSGRITSGQIGVDITKNLLDPEQYQELETCPECGGELLLEKQKSKPYKRTHHKLKCEYCDYYKIQELCKLNPVTVDKKPGDWCGQFK